MESGYKKDGSYTIAIEGYFMGMGEQRAKSKEQRA
jgi:hypothetical protein